MRLPVSSGKLKDGPGKGGDSRVWYTLERIRVALGLDHGKFADLLKLTRSRYERLRKADKSPSLFSVEALLCEIHLSFDRFMSGDIDFVALAERFHRRLDYLPERYSKAAFSRRRTSVDVLEALRALHGWGKVHSVLRHFQIDESVFDKPDEYISLNFLKDLSDHLIQTGISEDQLAEMGKFTVLVNRDSPMGIVLGQSRSPRELYDLQINHLMHHYDSNYSYRMTKQTSGSCEIEMRQNADVAAEMGVRFIGSKGTCASRRGRAAAALGFIGLPHSSVVETHCVHRGDPVCRLDVNYEFAAHAQKRGEQLKRPS